MAQETTNYQCPSCNGTMHYDGNVGKLVCDYCGSTYTVEEIEKLYAEKQAAADAKAAGDRAQRAQAEVEASQHAEHVSAAAASETSATAVNAEKPESDAEDSVQAYLHATHFSEEDRANLRAYTCPSCGAELLTDQVTAVTRCPYCGNNTVIPGQLSDVLKPDYVIPFKYDKRAAIAALKNYYQGKKLLPKAFTQQNHLEEIQGVYVPFWLYTTECQAEGTFDAENVRVWTTGDEDITEVDHYRLTRAATMTFERVPADGSSKMPDAHMDSIEPYDYSELQPFSLGYLPGYLTDRYDLPASQCEPRARERIGNSAIDAMAATANGYSTVRPVDMKESMQVKEVLYALLPVWMLHTKWNDKDFLFAMNGQTGKLIGDLPIDRGKAFLHGVVYFVISFIILVLIVLFILS